MNLSYTKPIELQEPFRTNWLAALRSGSYRQTDNKLCRQDVDGVRSYCCLGVACDLVKSEVGIDWKPTDSSGILKMDLSSTMPTRAMRLSMFADANAIFDTDGCRFFDDLTALNDEKKYSFAQIADFIEQHTVGVTLTTE